MKKYILVRNSFGHEIMALNFAKALSMPVVILPKRDDFEEFEKESQRIYDSLSFLFKNIKKAPFSLRDYYENRSWDIVQDLRDQKLPEMLWQKFAETSLEPQNDVEVLPQYEQLQGQTNILFVPQKLVSDGTCGVTAQQQSLDPSKFNFLKNKKNLNLVLGQHFHKENDLAAIKALSQEFGLYVPGMSEHPEVFGIRGIEHRMYYHMYAQLKGAIGIAGTHTWLMLTMCPQIPQVILYNKNGVENWESIATAFRASGRSVWALPFGEGEEDVDLSRRIEESFKNIETKF